MNESIRAVWRRGVSRRVVKAAVLAVLLPTLLTTGTALAQATSNYDLGCRGAVTAAGGVIVHGNTGTISAVGEWTTGTTTSFSYGVRTGYMQPIPRRSATVSTAVAPAEIEQGGRILMPLLTKVGQIIRGCQY